MQVGRGQGHVSNFYILDLENFATATRRYTRDIHNTSVVGLFMTPIRQWKRLDRVMVLVHMFITHRPTVTPQIHHFYLFRTCRTSSFCTVALRGNWQDFNCHDASRGPSAIAELLVVRPMPHRQEDAQCVSVYLSVHSSMPGVSGW